jgi:hypothetical protein
VQAPSVSEILTDPSFYATVMLISMTTWGIVAAILYLVRRRRRRRRRRSY